MALIDKNIQLGLPLLRKEFEKIVGRIRRELGRVSFVVGVDVGTSCIKVIQLSDVDGRKKIVYSAMVDIQGLSQNEAEVLASLKTALIGVPARDVRVVALVNCPQTSTRKILTPHMPKKDLFQAVRWEARNAIPFPIEEAVMDFEILGESSEKGMRKLTVAVAAAPQKTVERLLNLFEKAKIEISSLVPVSLSIQNLMARSREYSRSTVAVVEMGALMTELNIYAQGRLTFSRRLPVAGNDITKAMTSPLMSSQGKVELSLQEAEEIKKEYGIPRGDEPEPLRGKILAVHMLSLIRPCLEQLAGEIERSFDFYREESHGGRVQKILLFGGGAQLKGLAEFLCGELGVEVVLGNAFEFVDDVDEEQKTMGGRFDLALGAAFSQKITLNLLPLAFRKKAQRVLRDVAVRGVGTALIVSLALFYAGAQIRLFGYKRERKALKLEQAVMAPKLEKLRAAVMVGELLKGKPYWEDVLREISHVIPGKVYLTKMEMKDNILHLSGEALRGARDPQEALSEFMLLLEEGILKNVSLVTAQKRADNPNILEFEITCHVE